jgi:hypothetical protein
LEQLSESEKFRELCSETWAGSVHEQRKEVRYRNSLIDYNSVFALYGNGLILGSLC